MSYAMVAAAVIGVVGSVYSANQSKKNANKALAQQESMQNDARIQAAEAKQQALDTEKSADEANNRMAMKSPDTSAMMSAAMMSGKAGVSGTMLTGSQGVDKDKLKTGRSTLLGA